MKYSKAVLLIILSLLLCACQKTNEDGNQNEDTVFEVPEYDFEVDEEPVSTNNKKTGLLLSEQGNTNQGLIETITVLEDGYEANEYEVIDFTNGTVSGETVIVDNQEPVTDQSSDSENPEISDDANGDQAYVDDEGVIHFPSIELNFD